MSDPSVYIVTDNAVSLHDATGAVFSYGDNETTITRENDEDEIVAGAIFGVVNGPWHIWVKPLSDGPVKEAVVDRIYRFGDVLFRGTFHDTGERCEFRGTIVHAIHEGDNGN